MSKVSTTWSWIKVKYNQFNDWCATWMPGLKVKIASGFGAIGMGAGYLQEYISGLPLDKFMTATQVAMVGGLLFSLVFWFKFLTNRAPD